MKKIVFSNLVMQKNLHKMLYKVEGDSSIQYDKAVCFPVNGVLARTMKKGDDIKVVLIKLMDYEGNTDVNEQVFKDELAEINAGIGANIEYVTIEAPFDEGQRTHKTLLLDIVKEMDKGADILADITYGPKPEAIIMFTALKFAHNALGANIRGLIYGKVDFRTEKDGTKTPINPVLYNLTSLFFLHAIIDSFEDMDKDNAIDVLERLLNM